MTSTLVDTKDHTRTIIHIDIDCFYAQVEMIKNPDLRTKPLGVQQKNIVVTSNYVAREFGIRKCMLVTEALKLCPNLVLVKGEDLYDYRQMSGKVSLCIYKFTNCVEKLGLDENFIDISELVKNRIKNLKEQEQPVGHIFGSAKEECICGCIDRINIGSLIASEIRKTIKDELGLTCCAGISHNKLLAKLGGAVNKPDQQTIIYPSNAGELLGSLPDLRSIPGIGHSTYEIFKSADLKTIEDVRNCPLEKLIELFGAEKAKYYTDLCYGLDNSPVKQTGKPQSIGLEDACRTISIEEEVQEKFRQLLRRLMILVSEDGRIPRTLKVTLRKFDTIRKTSHREQRQCNISPGLFSVEKVKMTPEAEDKIIASIMHLFHKMVDIKNPFHVTLLGLAFTKFQERRQGKHSIVSFLMKNVSVHSITNVQYTQNSDTIASCMDYSPIRNRSTDIINTDGSESEVEPSPKKCKLGKLIAKRRCLNHDDGASPSKLRVAELRLNSKEMDRPPTDSSFIYPDNSTICSNDNAICSNSSTIRSNDKVICLDNNTINSNSSSTCSNDSALYNDTSSIYPKNVDPDVFKELPIDMQNELLQQWKIQKQVSCSPVSKPKTNSILNYLIRNKN